MSTPTPITTTASRPSTTTTATTTGSLRTTSTHRSRPPGLCPTPWRPFPLPPSLPSCQCRHTPLRWEVQVEVKVKGLPPPAPRLRRHKHQQPHQPHQLHMVDHLYPLPRRPLDIPAPSPPPQAYRSIQ